MNYERTIPFEGDFHKIAEIAKNILQSHGFDVVSGNDTSIEFIRYRFITPKREKPILGTSQLTIQLENKSLTIKSDLDKTNKTFKFLSMSMIAIDMVILPLITISMVKDEEPIQKILPLTAIILSGLIIGIPLMRKIMKNNAIESLDTLLNNMITLGQEN